MAVVDAFEDMHKHHVNAQDSQRNVSLHIVEDHTDALGAQKGTMDRVSRAYILNSFDN